MSQAIDDEAFIRAIIDAPGDDAPRLVYADWLDEHGDPRGRYVREEMTCFRAAYRSDSDTLPGPPDFQRLMDSLDPVWIARISRPPLGILADHIHWYTDILPGPELSNADLDAFERQHRIVMPVQYRAFLLNWNGGYPYPADFAVPGDDPAEPSIRLDSFGRIPSSSGPPASARAPHEIYGPAEGIRLGNGSTLAIAGDSSDGVLFLGATGNALGRVYWHPDWTHSFGDLEDLVELGTLAEFLDGLQNDDPEAMQAVVRNEPERLKRCLDAGFDVNWTDPETEWGLIDTAAIYHRLECVRILAERGVKATKATKHAARQCGDPEIIALMPKPERRWWGSR